MHPHPKAPLHLAHQRGSTDTSIFGASALEKGNHLGGELVATTRPALLRQQTREPLALPSCPRFVERRARQAECSRCGGHGVALGFDTTQHLVLDLEQVTGVEEVVLVEQRIGDRLGVAVKHALGAQGLSLRIRASCLGHGLSSRKYVK